ncbi:MAG: type II secretion system protein GspM [Gemmatimonadaceae bacterium]
MRASERRTVMIGLWVSGLALAFAFVVMPFWRRVTDRGAQIALKREQVARLRSYVRHRADFDSAATSRAALLDASPARVLRGRSPALAAAELQRVLQDAARMSRVSVSRLDVAGVADTNSGRLTLPATVSAVSDIYGLVQLLGALQQGRPLMDVKELTVLSTSALRGDLLQVSLQVRAPFLTETAP